MAIVAFASGRTLSQIVPVEVRLVLWSAVFRHWGIDLFERDSRKDVCPRVGVPTIACSEPPQLP
jgi:hypothetical protein